MKLLTAVAAVWFLFVAAAAAEAACVYPQPPQSLPNGNTATKDEMLAAQAKVKEYKTAVEEVYLPCLEKEKNDTVAALDPADPQFAQKKLAAEEIQSKKHNAAFDELNALAARWNDERKAFTAKSAK